MRGLGIWVVAGVLLVAVSGGASADTIQEFTAGTGSNTFAPGQSVTTGAGPGWNSLEFNWFNTAGGDLASGTLYLLSQDYAGAPGALGAATPGFLAASTGIVGGRYVFDAGVTIGANTQYFFYTDSTVTALTGGVGYAGGSVYASFGGAAYYNAAGEDANFRLSGSPVPEPTTLALFGLGAGALALRRRRRKLA